MVGWPSMLINLSMGSGIRIIEISLKSLVCYDFLFDDIFYSDMNIDEQNPEDFPYEGRGHRISL